MYGIHKDYKVMWSLCKTSEKSLSPLKSVNAFLLRLKSHYISYIYTLVFFMNFHFRNLYLLSHSHTAWIFFPKSEFLSLGFLSSSLSTLKSIITRGRMWVESFSIILSSISSVQIQEPLLISDLACFRCFQRRSQPVSVSVSEEGSPHHRVKWMTLKFSEYEREMILTLFLFFGFLKG